MSGGGHGFPLESVPFIIILRNTVTSGIHCRGGDGGVPQSSNPSRHFPGHLWSLLKHVLQELHLSPDESLKFFNCHPSYGLS